MKSKKILFLAVTMAAVLLAVPAQAAEAPAIRVEMLQFADVVGELINGTMLLSLVISAVSLVAFYLLARYLLDTQLNLE